MDDIDEKFFTAYGELAGDGRCDIPGGAECDRVHAAWVASGRPVDNIVDFIVKHANQVPAAKPRWIWVYGYTPVPNAFPLKKYETSSEPQIVDRIDEVHLFPDETIPPEKRGTTTFVLERKHVPLCNQNLYEKRPKWQLFNTGGADVKRLATHAGNSTIICPACEALDPKTT